MDDKKLAVKAQSTESYKTPEDIKDKSVGEDEACQNNPPEQEEGEIEDAFEEGEEDDDAFEKEGGENDAFEEAGEEDEDAFEQEGGENEDAFQEREEEEKPVLGQKVQVLTIADLFGEDAHEVEDYSGIQEPDERKAASSFSKNEDNEGSEEEGSLGEGVVKYKYLQHFSPESSEDEAASTNVKCSAASTSVKCSAASTSVKCSVTSTGVQTSVKCSVTSTSVKCSGASTSVKCSGASTSVKCSVGVSLLSDSSEDGSPCKKVKIAEEEEGCSGEEGCSEEKEAEQSA